MTTGNALTVGMGVQGLFRAAQEAGIDPAKARFAAIGAAGNIASTYAALVAEQVPDITLIGKPRHEKRLARITSEIYADAFEQILRLTDGATSEPAGIAGAICNTKTVRAHLSRYPDVDQSGSWLLDHLAREMKDRAPVRFTMGFGGLREADLILGASNAPEALIYPSMLREGPAVICDISVPADTDPSVERLRDDVIVFQGGIVRLPCNPTFTVGGVPLEPGLSFACMAETLLLGLEGRRGNYSYAGSIRPRSKKSPVWPDGTGSHWLV